MDRREDADGKNQGEILLGIIHTLTGPHIVFGSEHAGNALHNADKHRIRISAPCRYVQNNVHINFLQKK